MSKLRVAVIGCGTISEFHLAAWARIPDVELVALVDPRVDAAAAQRDRFAPAAGIHSSVADLLARETLDVVDILSPPARHAEHARLAKAAGLHVICQKPLSDDLDEARALVAEFAGGPELLSVHENHVFRPWFARLAALHRDGFFGELYRVRIEQFDASSPPQAINRQAPRGVLLQYGVHLIDMARHLLGTPDAVDARLAHANPELAGESFATVSLRYPDATAQVDVAWKQHGVPQGSALLLGARGEAFYEGTMTRGGPARLRISRGAELVSDETIDTDHEYRESFYLFQRAFVDALLTGTPPPQPAAENLQTLELTFAAYAAAAYEAATPERNHRT